MKKPFFKRNAAYYFRIDGHPYVSLRPIERTNQKFDYFCLIKEISLQSFHE